MKRLKELPQYTDMTIEEFVTLCPEVSQNVPCQGRPIFWPPFEEIVYEKEVKVVKKDAKGKEGADPQPDNNPQAQKEAKDEKPKDEQPKDDKPKDK